MNQVLSLPEIVSQVVDKTTGADSINCLCVNQLWFQESIRLLWQHSPPLEYLQRLSHDRLKIYAALIETLFLHERELYRMATLDVNLLTKLKSVSFENWDFPSDTLFTLCLAPTLQRISIYGGLITDKFLDTIAQRCPDLTTFELHTPSPLTSEGLQALLHGCVNLRRLIIGIEAVAFIERGIMDKLGSSRVYALGLPPVEPGTLISNLTNITQLHCTLNGDASLLTFFPNLTELNATVRNLPEAMNVIGQHGRIITLTLDATGETFLPLEFVCLASASLTNITLFFCSSEESRYIMDDAAVDRFTKAAPNLREVVMYISRGQFSPKSLISFGQHCKHLQKLSFGLHGSFSIDRIVDKHAPLFPNLIKLGITTAMLRYSDAIAKGDDCTAEFWRKHAPRLPKYHCVCRKCITVFARNVLYVE